MNTLPRHGQPKGPVLKVVSKILTPSCTRKSLKVSHKNGSMSPVCVRGLNLPAAVRTCDGAGDPAQARLETIANSSGERSENPGIGR